MKKIMMLSRLVGLWEEGRRERMVSIAHSAALLLCSS
jgi:hypothetical protein